MNSKSNNNGRIYPEEAFRNSLDDYLKKILAVRNRNKKINEILELPQDIEDDKVLISTGKYITEVKIDKLKYNI